MNESSLQLVEMCSEGVWSPVCDHNWTVADASVACKELGYQGCHYKKFPAKSSITSLKPPHCAYTKCAGQKILVTIDIGYLFAKTLVI